MTSFQDLHNASKTFKKPWLTGYLGKVLKEPKYWGSMTSIRKFIIYVLDKNQQGFPKRSSWRERGGYCRKNNTAII